MSTFNSVKKEYLADYLIDEFGRVVIKNKHILKHISGAGDLDVNPLGTNNLCGSNLACANVKCK